MSHFQPEVLVELKKIASDDIAGDQRATLAKAVLLLAAYCEELARQINELRDGRNQ